MVHFSQSITHSMDPAVSPWRVTALWVNLLPLRMEISLLGRGEGLESDRSDMEGGFFSEEDRRGGGGRCYGGKRLWLAASHCKQELPNCFAQRWLRSDGFLDFMQNSVKSTNHMQSDPFNDLIWFGPLSYAVLNQIQEGSLSMRPQVEQSSCN